MPEMLDLPIESTKPFADIKPIKRRPIVEKLNEYVNISFFLRARR